MLVSLSGPVTCLGTGVAAARWCAAVQHVVLHAGPAEKPDDRLTAASAVSGSILRGPRKTAVTIRTTPGKINSAPTKARNV